PSVLILGVPGGIGLALADQLSQLGYGLTLAARNRGRQDVLATELNANSSSVDVTNSAEVEASVAGGFEMHSRQCHSLVFRSATILGHRTVTGGGRWGAWFRANANRCEHLI
ncbi:MAG: SDR family NAD(P)-dependent oxidoreductase, partial [Verrucomicrobiota bacterium]